MEDLWKFQLTELNSKKKQKKLLDGKVRILFLCNLCFFCISLAIACIAFFIPNPLEKILSLFIYKKRFSNFQFFSIAININWLCWCIYMFIRSIIFVALIFPFYVCLATVPLCIVSKEKIQIAKIFLPISKSRYFIEYAVAGVQKYLCTILWALLLFFPGVLAHYRYSFTKYIFAEQNEITAGEAIFKSKKIAEENKWSLFMLDLSFFGWLAIGIITCGLGLFFAIGYHEIVYAMFYKKMAECKENTVPEQEQSSSAPFQEQSTEQNENTEVQK